VIVLNYRERQENYPSDRNPKGTDNRRPAITSTQAFEQNKAKDKKIKNVHTHTHTDSDSYIEKNKYDETSSETHKQSNQYTGNR